MLCDTVSEFVCTSSRKRKSYGRVSDASRKLRAQSFETGEDCKCRKKCFCNLQVSDIQKIIHDFNALGDWNAQSAYLAGLITVQLITRRRNRKNEDDAQCHDASYSYRVRNIDEDGNFTDVLVCQKAFLSLHGIKKKRLQTIQSSIKYSGIAPTDGRGKHNNRRHKLSTDTHDKICQHIKSFKGRSSHYSMEKTSKIYLPDDLNIKKMYEMYCDINNEHHVSYETYRTIFSTEFNISFGYPRCDTCSTCDECEVKLKGLDIELKNLSIDNTCRKDEIGKEKNALGVQKKVHLAKAQTFYQRKTKSKKRSRTSREVESIVFDYQKNLPIPNISSNIVYYKRQLSFYSFNVHQLSDSKSVFYTYTETTGRKGANEVVSFLDHYFQFELSSNVRHLELFCDSCSGQNKNYTLFRYLHYMVHEKNRFSSILVTFPIRGHSYLECDKNMGLVSAKSKTEVPEDWNNILISARAKPTPFKVIEVDNCMIRDWNAFLEALYLKKCSFQSRPIREMRIEENHPRMVIHRDSYNGAWLSSVIRPPLRKRPVIADLLEGEFPYPHRAYEGNLPISKEKWLDLQALKVLCGSDAQKFYTELPKKVK